MRRAQAVADRQRPDRDSRLLAPRVPSAGAGSARRPRGTPTRGDDGAARSAAAGRRGPGRDRQPSRVAPRAATRSPRRSRAARERRRRAAGTAGSAFRTVVLPASLRPGRDHHRERALDEEPQERRQLRVEGPGADQLDDRERVAARACGPHQRAWSNDGPDLGGRRVGHLGRAYARPARQRQTDPRSAIDFATDAGARPPRSGWRCPMPSPPDFERLTIVQSPRTDSPLPRAGSSRTSARGPPSRARPVGPDGRRLRLPRTERCRQDHDDAHPDRADPRGRRLGAAARARLFAGGHRQLLFDVGALIESPAFYPYLSGRREPAGARVDRRADAAEPRSTKCSSSSASATARTTRSSGTRWA